MPSRPELSPRALAAAALAMVALAASGCGKGAYREGSTASASLPPASSGPLAPPAQGNPATPANPPPAASAPVPLPLPLTRARAEAFAHSVLLGRYDLPGSTPSARSKSSAAQEREAARCGGRKTEALGGASSPTFHRGAGLNREGISSSVQVLGDAAAVKGDLEYASSKAGLACYAKVLGQSLREEQNTHLKLRNVRVGRIGITIGPSERASGIRVTADVEVVKAQVQVRLFVDAVSLPYGPAELDVFATSFVQPEPERTERELLALLRERALLRKL